MGTMSPAAQSATYVRYDDPAVDHPCQTLEAFVYLMPGEHLLGRFFHISFTIAKETYAPTMHVLSGLFGEDGQIFLRGVAVTCRKCKNVTHMLPCKAQDGIAVMLDLRVRN